jgi:hypothetical protein
LNSLPHCSIIIAERDENVNAKLMPFIMLFLLSSCAAVENRAEPFPQEALPEAEPEAWTPPPLAVSKVTYRFPDGSIDQYAISTYNENKERIRETTYSASGAVMSSEKYTYTDGLLSLKVTQDEAGRTDSQVSYAYTPQGRLAEEVYRDRDGAALTTCRYAYNDKNLLASVTIWNSLDIKILETRYDYDRQRVAKTETFDNGGRLIGSSAREYDDEGRVSVERNFDAGGNLTRTITTSRGKPEKVEFRAGSGELQRRETNEYGERGELLRKTTEDFDAKTQRIAEFEYVE